MDDRVDDRELSTPDVVRVAAATDEVPDWCRTARCTLRPWRAAEASRLFDIRRRPEVTDWLGDPTPWRDVAQAEQAIERWATCTELPRVSLAIVPNDTGIPVGTIMASHLPDSDELEIGWFLHPDSQGSGWASEAASALHAHAIVAGAKRIWAGMWPHNDASAGVCQHIGMTDLGLQIDPWYGTAPYPMSRQFCTWPDGIELDDPEHPFAVLNRLRADMELPESDVVPPVGPGGRTYESAVGSAGQP